MPRGHLYVQLMVSISAGGPTMFMNCHLQMMMSYADTRTAIQQNGLPLGSMCKQFPHTHQLKHRLGNLPAYLSNVDIQSGLFWTPKSIHFGGPDSQMIQLDIPPWSNLPGNCPVFIDLCSNSHGF